MLWAAFSHYKAAGKIQTGLRLRLAQEGDRTEAAHRQLADVLNTLSAQICVLDEAGRIVSVNDSWRNFHVAHGDRPDQVHEGAPYLAANPAIAQARPAPPAPQDEFATLLQEVLTGRRDGFEMEYASHSRTAMRWFYARVSRIHGSAPMRVVVTHEDVTALRSVQNELGEALSFTRKLIDAMQDGVLVLDNDGVSLDVNPSLCRMTGFARDELVNLKPPFPYWPPPEHEHIQTALRKTLLAGGGDFELSFVRKNGERFAVDVAASTVIDEAGLVIGAIATVKDITEHKRMQADIQNLAFHDPLTRLPNRRLFQERLGRALAANKRSGHFGAVLLLDLDNFKPLNDLHGHDAGDLLLEQVATRLQACVREVDTVARLGGDEFVVIISALDGERASSTAHARAVAEKIRVALAEPYRLALPRAGQLQGVEHHCAASIGVYVFGAAAIDEAGILKRADAAMYQAKADGRNRVRVYTGPDEPASAGLPGA